MKDIQYKKRLNKNKNLKSFTIHQKNEDKKCITKIRKGFLYNICENFDENTDLQSPEIYIKKHFDSKKRVEDFSFRVKGYFFIKQNRRLLKVIFRHSLKINMQWKSKIFSPDESEMLT